LFVGNGLAPAHNITPGFLSVNRVTNGGFLDSGFFPGVIDNGAGTVSFIADSLAGPVPGLTGSGTLATIELLALAQGVSSIRVSNVILLDSSLRDITVENVDGSVTVADGGPSVPEPASWLLLAVGAVPLLGIAGRKRSDAAMIMRLFQRT
jgi:general secretion pathway protein D